jgi:pimeloyl-ACP methyl ester carboxylesterase
MRSFIFSALATIAGRTNEAITTSSFVLAELTLPCPDGTVIAAQRWTHVDAPPNSPSKHRMLCIHGWMDNCRSFHYLAPALIEGIPDLEIVALDLPGHGQSSHKSLDAPPVVSAEAVYYISEAINALQWNTNDTEATTTTASTSTSKFAVCGHSLGAAQATLYAATFPEQVSQLIMLDGGAFLTRDARNTGRHVREHIEERRKQTSIKKAPRVYRNIELAIRTRRHAATYLVPGGSQTISYEAANELVRRATCRVNTSNDNNDEKTQGVQFCNDPRYQWPSLQYMSWEQNEGMFEAIECPNCILLADDGWPHKPEHVQRVKDMLSPSTYEWLPGSHYFHADPDAAGAVSEAVLGFLRREFKK